MHASLHVGVYMYNFYLNPVVLEKLKNEVDYCAVLICHEEVILFCVFGSY